MGHYPGHLLDRDSGWYAQPKHAVAGCGGIIGDRARCHGYSPSGTERCVWFCSSAVLTALHGIFVALRKHTAVASMVGAVDLGRSILVSYLKKNTLTWAVPNAS